MNTSRSPFGNCWLTHTYELCITLDSAEGAFIKYTHINMHEIKQYTRIL